ncbi:MAG: hypothetical protein ACTSVA_07045 [Candidatus Njordarchaeales archaeon]
MEEVMSFKSRISKKGREGYYIKVPKSLDHISEKIHGKTIIVKVYIEKT